MPKNEESGTTVVITGPEDRVSKLIKILRGCGVPIMNDPPDVQCHPAPDAPEDIKVCTLIVDSAGWDDADKAAAAAKSLREEISRL